eukprot:1248627-Karenia_brevis.AAC.1
MLLLGLVLGFRRLSMAAARLVWLEASLILILLAVPFWRGCMPGLNFTLGKALLQWPGKTCLDLENRPSNAL